MERKAASQPTFKDAFAPIKAQFQKDNKLWENARLVLADVPIDKAAVKRILPAYLSTSDGMATMFIASYPKTSFTAPYREAAVLIHVKTPLGRGVHCPWMIVDDDTALIYGREMLGYPKKMGSFTFEETAGAIRAGLRRRGADLLSLEAKIGRAVTNPPSVFSVKTFNVRHSSGVFILNRIWMFRPDERISRYNEAEISVAVAESEADPIARLIDGGPINGRVATVDITGSRYMIPVWAATYRWLAYNHTLRFV